MNITSLPKLIRTIQKLNGSKGALSLGAKQLKFMAKENKNLAQALATLKEPAMDVAYKAKSNYNVAAFRLKDGKNTVVKGAVSLQNPGTRESILKYRLNIGENGTVARSNGFIDTGKKLNFDDIETFGKRKNGVTSASVASGDAMRFAAEVNEKQAIKLAEQIQPGSGYGFVGRLKSNSKAGQMIEKLNSAWENIGKKLAGVAESKAVKVADNVNFDKYSAKKLKNLDIKNFVKAHAGDIQKAKIAEMEKDCKYMLDDMENLKKKFATCMDNDLKIKIAAEFKEAEMKYNDKSKYLKDIIEQLK